MYTLNFEVYLKAIYVEGVPKKGLLEFLMKMLLMLSVPAAKPGDKQTIKRYSKRKSLFWATLYRLSFKVYFNLCMSDTESLMAHQIKVFSGSADEVIFSSWVGS